MRARGRRAGDGKEAKAPTPPDGGGAGSGGSGVPGAATSPARARRGRRSPWCQPRTTQGTGDSSPDAGHGNGPARPGLIARRPPPAGTGCSTGCEINNPFLRFTVRTEAGGSSRRDGLLFMRCFPGPQAYRRSAQARAVDAGLMTANPLGRAGSMCLHLPPVRPITGVIGRQISGPFRRIRSPLDARRHPP